MAKARREYLLHYIDAATAASGGFSHKKFSDVTAQSASTWVLIGEDIEDMSVEMNNDVESFKNILGQTKITDNGYEPSMSADPFYADSTNALSNALKTIALERRSGDDCKTLMLEVWMSSPSDTSHTAFVREVSVKPTSYGGDTAGLNIPFEVSENGAYTKGTARITNGVPTFTAASS